MIGTCDGTLKVYDLNDIANPTVLSHETYNLGLNRVHFAPSVCFFVLYLFLLYLSFTPFHREFMLMLMMKKIEQYTSMPIITLMASSAPQLSLSLNQTTSILELFLQWRWNYSCRCIGGDQRGKILNILYFQTLI